MKKVAVIQSNYIPWKGYFDIINDCDVFIFYDDVQYTKNDWRNRNKIKSGSGAKWLTIPVGSPKGRLIYEVELVDKSWAKKHWEHLVSIYSSTPYFMKYREFLSSVYLDSEWGTLSELNQFMIKTISQNFLGIKAEFLDSRVFSNTGKKQEKLLNLLKDANADIYISGPAAKDYIEDSKFEEANINLIYKDYNGYPEYSQLYPPFDHYVSILDLLFHVGPEAPYFIWGWRQEKNVAIT